MGAYGSLLPTDRQSALGAFLQPMAEGFAGGIEDDRVRRRNISDRVDAYKSLMPYQMETFQKQHEILGTMQAQRDDASLRKALLLEGYKRSMDPRAAAQTELSGMLKNRQTSQVPWAQTLETPTTGSPNYSASEEAASGMAPTGSRTKTLPIDRSRAAGLAVQAGIRGKDLEAILNTAEPGSPSSAIKPAERSTYMLDTGDKIQIRSKADDHVIEEVPRVRSAGAGQGMQNMYGKVFFDEGKKMGMSDTEAADYATQKTSQGYIAPTTTARSAASVEGGYTGPAREAKAGTAFATGQASSQGGISGKLSPVDVPGESGQPKTRVPGVTAVTTAAEMGKGIEGAEKKALSELYTLRDMSGRIRELSGNFTKPYFGLAHNIEAWTRERVGGKGGIPGIAPLPQEEIILRRHVNDMKDALLRARSGAQINEQEYVRLAKLLPSMDLPQETAMGRMAGFEEQLTAIIRNRESVQSGIQGQIGGGKVTPRLNLKQADPLEGKTATGPSGQKLIRRNGAWVPYGQ